MHNGLDFGGVPRGHIWTTPFDGVVTRVGTHGGRGLVVVVKVGETLHLFQHLDKALVRKGDRVKGATSGQPLLRGDAIGTNGTTGDVTGPHLHYEIRWDNGTLLGAPVWGDPAKFTLEVSNVQTYTVVPGDTLAKIAARFGVTVTDLRGWNNRTPDQDRNLQVGTILFVSDPTPAPSGVSKPDFDKLASRVSELERKLAEVKQIL